MQFIVDQYRGTIFEMGWGMIPKQIMVDKSISKNGKLIYAYLASYAWATSGESKQAYPKQLTISLDLDMSETLIRKELKKLYESGYVKMEKIDIPIEERRSPKARQRNKYYLTSIMREITENKDEFRLNINPITETLENIEEFEPLDFEPVQNEALQNKTVIKSKKILREKDFNKSSSVNLKTEKKNDYDFLNNYSLKKRTITNIIKNFKDITPQVFQELYTKLKADPRVKSIDGAIITSLNGDWEEFELPVKNKKSSKIATRGDSTTLVNIEKNKIVDKKHILESEAETNNFMETFNNLQITEQALVLEEAKKYYLEQSNTKKFDTVHKKIFETTKKTYIREALKKLKLE